MGRVYYQSISLEDAVRQSSVIVKATPCASNRREKYAIDIPQCPEFIIWVHNYQIDKVILGDAVRVGAIIKVHEADVGFKLNLHEKYYKEGISKSPIFESYDSPKLNEDEPRILLLKQSEIDPNMFEFVVNTTYESVDKEGEIRSYSTGNVSPSRITRRQYMLRRCGSDNKSSQEYEAPSASTQTTATSATLTSDTTTTTQAANNSRTQYRTVPSKKKCSIL